MKQRSLQTPKTKDESTETEELRLTRDEFKELRETAYALNGMTWVLEAHNDEEVKQAAHALKPIDEKLSDILYKIEQRNSGRLKQILPTRD